MRTTLNINEKVLAEVMRVTGEKSKSKAIKIALEWYVNEFLPEKRSRRSKDQESQNSSIDESDHHSQLSQE